MKHRMFVTDVTDVPFDDWERMGHVGFWKRWAGRNFKPLPLILSRWERCPVVNRISNWNPGVWSFPIVIGWHNRLLEHVFLRVSSGEAWQALKGKMSMRLLSSSRHLSLHGLPAAYSRSAKYPEASHMTESLFVVLEVDRKRDKGRVASYPRFGFHKTDAENSVQTCILLHPQHYM